MAIGLALNAWCKIWQPKERCFGYIVNNDCSPWNQFQHYEFAKQTQPCQKWPILHSDVEYSNWRCALSLNDQRTIVVPTKNKANRTHGMSPILIVGSDWIEACCKQGALIYVVLIYVPFSRTNLRLSIMNGPGHLLLFSTQLRWMAARIRIYVAFSIYSLMVVKDIFHQERTANWRPYHLVASPFETGWNADGTLIEEINGAIVEAPVVHAEHAYGSPPNRILSNRISTIIAYVRNLWLVGLLAIFFSGS